MKRRSKRYKELSKAAVAKKIDSKEWVTKYHDIENVCSSLYTIYKNNSWIK